MRESVICSYINKSWCKDTTVLERTCNMDFESLFINCKPFIHWGSSPHLSWSVFTYIPCQACAKNALHLLANWIMCMEQKQPDTLLIVLGDFNRANHTHKLLKYRQHVSCPTRDRNTLDHCYTVIKDAYRSVPQVALSDGHSYSGHSGLSSWACLWRSCSTFSSSAWEYLA